MANFAIPLKVGGTGAGSAGASYDDVIDASLNLYTPQLKNYPVADAFELSGDTSQEFWGLQGITARNGQNTARQGSLSFGVVIGTGILSRKSVVPMTKVINKITNGNYKYALYVDGGGYTNSGNSLAMSTQDTQMNDVKFNNDGSKVFTVGYTNDNVYEYALSTPYDLTTGSFTQSLSVATQDNVPQGLDFNNDGTKMYVCGNQNDSVYEYTLSTGFDISTASFSQSQSIATNSPSPSGLSFNSDGTKMYTIKQTTDTITEYSLSSAFDVSTLSYTQEFSVSAQDSGASAFAFKPDGSKFFLAGTTNDKIYEYDLSVPFDVSSMVFASDFAVTNLRGVAFSTDGSKMFPLVDSSAALLEYDDSGVTMDIDLNLNGVTIDTYIISGFNLNGTYFFDSNLDGISVGVEKIVFEAVTKNVVNTGSKDIKLGLGLTGGTYDTPTGNYEVSTLDLLL